MESFSIQKLQELLSSSKSMSFRSDTLNPLFENEQEYNAWKLNRNVKQILQDKALMLNKNSSFHIKKRAISWYHS